MWTMLRSRIARRTVDGALVRVGEVVKGAAGQPARTLEIYGHTAP
jgi:hypothetical protein